MISESIQTKIRNLPEKPGVYQYLDKDDQIIYVGKAKNLKKRVASYFSKDHENGKTKMLVKKIVEIKYIIVQTELDALLLENNLIKKYRPKYNIQLKDDKTYPWICIKKEPFPRVFSTRRVIKDGSKYYGPYASVKVMNTLLQLFRELFPLRTCNLDLSDPKIQSKNYKVCLEYHIGNCKGPCVGLILKVEYQEYIDQIDFILKGNIRFVVNYIRKKMLKFAEKQRFEEAQLLKEKLSILENFQTKSTIVSPTIHEVDVITLVEDEKNAFVNYLVIKNGSVIHGITVELIKKLDETKQEILTYSLLDLRERFHSISKEVIVEEKMAIQIPGIQFFVPKKGDKKQLLELSKKNATYYRLEKYKNEHIKNPEAHTDRILNQIKTDLRLKELPIYMECFDNSNIQGTNAVSACVVFKNVKPSKQDYRHFNIRTVEGPNDFASMEEVITRRYSRLLNEKKELPQLIIIDGGKGQLSSAVSALEKIGLKGKIAIVGIAKRLEEIFFPGDSLPIYLDKRSESLKVIQQMRNEAHRFGITHHRSKRSKEALNSELNQIKGIGLKTFEQLMKKFKTISKIKQSNLEDLAKEIGQSKAKIVFNYFSK